MPRLRVLKTHTTTHTALACSVAWCGSDLLSCSDDGCVWRWDKNGEPVAQVCNVETSFTDMHWLPPKRAHGSSTQSSGAASGADTSCVVGCTDGSFRFLNPRAGRVEKVVEKAHSGAVTCVRWTSEGNTLLTAGEDGYLKLWSRKGQQRQILGQLGKCVYSVAFSPSCDSILVTVGKDLLIKPLSASGKASQWTAHDAPILRVDWNPVNNLILSGGEDLKYKVWDSYARLLFTSSPWDHPITSIRWAPDGEDFAVGSFNLIRVCDRTGWSYCAQKLDTGSVYDISWMPDGLQLAAAGGNGSVTLAALVDRQIEWKDFSVLLDENNLIRVTNIGKDIGEEAPLEFRNRVIKMAMGFDHLVVATTTQLYIYDTTKWANSIPMDTKEPVSLIVLAEKFFVTADPAAGLQLFSYEGRLLCNPRTKGLRTDHLNNRLLSISVEYIACIDGSDSKSILIFDSKGRPQPPFQHTTEIFEILLSQHNTMDRGGVGEPMLALIDKNSDLFITPVQKKAKWAKLSSMVDTAIWHPDSCILATLGDSKFSLYYYPPAVHFAPDLLSKTCVVRDGSDFGQHAQFASLLGSRAVVRRGDGTKMTLSIPSYLVLLHQFAGKIQMPSALKLCRYVKDEALWASLGIIATKAKDLGSARMAFAAIDEVDRVQFLNALERRTCLERVNAELMLFLYQQQEAEETLLQGGLVYRAIKMNINMFNWEKALKIAEDYQTHVDTVLFYRQKYLKDWNKQETIPKFVKLLKEAKLDPQAIKAQQVKERELEAQRGQQQQRGMRS